MSTDDRAAEIAGRLAAVRTRIADACAAAGRDPGKVGLVVVTKFFPAADVARLLALGVRDVGENRDQEAAPKVAQVATLGPSPRWHFVGQVQTNKANSVARYAAAVHSVDRVRLVAALARGAAAANRTLDVLLQVGLDASGGRGGAEPGGLADLAAAVAAAPRLTLRGLMAVAPQGRRRWSTGPPAPRPGGLPPRRRTAARSRPHAPSAGRRAYPSPR